MVYGVYQMNENDTDEKVNEDLNNLLESLRLLEHSFVGGSGSRGYGKIKFKILEPIIIKAEDYKSGSDKYKSAQKELPKEENDYKDLSGIEIKI